MLAPDVLLRLSPEQVAEVRALIDDVTQADLTPPFSDHVMLHLPQGGDADVRHLLLRVGGGLVGYAHLDVTDVVAGSSAEVAVHPQCRGRGHGRALVEELLRQTPDGRLRLWAHGEQPAAAALAKAMGFARARVLWQMRRPLGDALPEAITPPGVLLRTFVVGQDEQAWTRTNNRAFSSHPDQGRWEVEEVLLREDEPWFDAAGFFLAERNGQLVGFHWTKVHGTVHAAHSGAGSEHVHSALGEVYVVGVDPAEQGHGLGPWLTLVGLHYLQDRGLDEVMLYVDEDNTNAISVYERLGFTRHATDVCFSMGA